MRCVCWMNERRKIVLRAAFVLYGILMLWLLFGQRYQGQLVIPDPGQMLEKMNLKPLHTIGNYLWVLEHSEDPGMRREATINLVGNVVMFVPLGYFLGALFVPFRRFWRVLLWSAVLICVVELLQILTMLGSLDIDDLILNLLGILLGWCVWKLTGKK